MAKRRRPSDRAVSTNLSYIFALTITTMLITGLVVAGSGFVNDRRKQVIRNELQVIGEQIASDLERADRLVVASQSSPTVRINGSYPETVTGAQYEVTLDGSNEQLELNSSRPDVDVSVDFETETSVGTATVEGGSIAVRFDGSNLVIADV